VQNDLSRQQRRAAKRWQRKAAKRKVGPVSANKADSAEDYYRQKYNPRSGRRQAS
jgi:hypothetical protein